ncbi:MAG: CAP domain-containing protein [Pseudomonadota bacterium]
MGLYLILRRVASLLAAVLALSATAAYACDRPVGASAAVDPNRINQVALSQAILAEVNHARCQSGLRALGQAPQTLLSSATAHSDWMAGARTLSHRGRGASGRTLRDRLNSARLPVRAASENIAQLPRYAFGTRQFRVVDRRSCQFEDARGRTIPAHSYGSLAQRVVALWLASPGHRRNVLDASVTTMAAGTAFSASNTCGDFWITQIFVG